jgi:CheY-like chemotaxis protein
VAREGSQAALRVRDNGIGIAPALLPHVFDLFVQGEQAGGRSQGGLGIGLTLVKNLVELHGGTVEAESPGIGQGAVFTVRLAVMQDAQDAPVPGERLVHRAPSSGRRVLVVDDNRDAAESLAMLLRAKGHEVHVAYDGASALRLAQAHYPAIVFLDLGMPGMDGYEVARRMRETPALAGTVLAALTGWGQAEARRRSAHAGFQHHLVKPPDAEALEKLLAQLEAAPG